MPGCEVRGSQAHANGAVAVAEQAPALVHAWRDGDLKHGVYNSMDVVSSPTVHATYAANGAGSEAPPRENAHASLSKLLRALSSGRRGGGDLDHIKSSCEGALNSLPAAIPSPAGASSAHPGIGIEVALPFIQALGTSNVRVVEDALEGLHELLAHGVVPWDVEYPPEPGNKVVANTPLRVPKP